MNASQDLSNYDRYYAQYSVPQSVFMALISAFSNLVSLPLVVSCFRAGQPFVGMCYFMSVSTSFMYHFCEIGNWTLYLNFSEWHRLDNIFAITCFSIYVLYITGNVDNRPILYSTLLTAILAQQKDPWNLSYTIGPILCYLLIGLGLNFYYKIGMPHFHLDRLWKGGILLAIGLLFFTKGLDEHTDYLRLNHGLWHLFLGWSSWYNYHSIKRPEDEFISIRSL